MDRLQHHLSLYIHVPFCDWKCTYCDFNSYAGLDDLIPAFTDALLKEIRAWGSLLDKRKVATIFLGGGTPSLLPPADVERILATLKQVFSLDPGAEISLEANPGTVDLDKLKAVRSAGVNRLSFGIQSFSNDELKFLTRIHDAETARRAYHDARRAGFDNINLDFIFGLPGQTKDTWATTVNEAIQLRPEHLSLYMLSVEENTPLGHDVARGLVAEADPDTVAGLYEWTCERMAQAGYKQYEISNWSLPGSQCRHNLNYWRNGDYLGFGPGAHSHLSDRRFAVVRSPQRYIRLMGAGGTDAFPFAFHEQVEDLDARREMSDTTWLGLRLNEGIDSKAFERRFGLPLSAAFPNAIARHVDMGLLEHLDGRLTLTPQGRLLANEVFSAFVSPSYATV